MLIHVVNDAISATMQVAPMAPMLVFLPVVAMLMLATVFSDRTA
ncbi:MULTISPECIES: hypothetical protein [Acetobacter]|uniref:Uncharacterized protein n=1 Tax=Acetobacter persici TaxID=1076596 RepID=A0A6V8I6G9_9PROT|nr:MULTISPECIES: hypothetical protein [Acetobacter]GFE93238.1 hypothetical protein DmAi_12970 [Acetobacter persici]